MERRREDLARIRFLPSQEGYAVYEPVEAVAIEVDDVDLRVLLGGADRLRFLPARSVTSGHFLGHPADHLADGGRVAVLTCSCGDYGCGGVSARIIVGDDLVGWEELSEPFNRGRLDVPDLHFDRGQYEHALRESSS